LKLNMKSMKSLLTAAVLLLLVPAASSAGLVGDVLCGLVPCSDTPTPPAVPEPSGALIMGAALLAVAVVRRHRR